MTSSAWVNFFISRQDFCKKPSDFEFKVFWVLSEFWAGKNKCGPNISLTSKLSESSALSFKFGILATQPCLLFENGQSKRWELNTFCSSNKSQSSSVKSSKNTSLCLISASCWTELKHITNWWLLFFLLVCIWNTNFRFYDLFWVFVLVSVVLFLVLNSTEVILSQHKLPQLSHLNMNNWYKPIQCNWNFQSTSMICLSQRLLELRHMIAPSLTTQTFVSSLIIEYNINSLKSQFLLLQIQQTQFCFIFDQLWAFGHLLCCYL